MNAELKKTERESVRRAFESLPGRLWRVVRRNWGLKLLCLFLAVCLWAGLITQDPTLTRERSFYDVPVSVVGSESLMNSGLVVLSGLEEENLSVRLRVDVPQRSYSSAQASNYNPRVDLSRITETGAQTLRIQATSTTTYGTVDSIYPDTVEVVVDEYVTNYRVPVTLNISGDYPAGFVGSTPQLDPGTVAVSGPKSVVDQLAYIYVDYDLSLLRGKEGQIRTALPMRFTDREGVEIDREKLRATSASVTLRTVTVEQKLYPTRTLSAVSLAQLEGEPAKGYEVRSVTASPASVLAAGESAALDGLDELFASGTVDVSGKSESFTVELPLRKPGALYSLSADALTVQVEIAPVVETRSFQGVRLTVRNVPEGLFASLSDKTATVSVTGPQNAVSQLNASRMTAYADLQNLSEGEYSLPVQVALQADGTEALSYVAQPSSVTVILQAK